MNAGIQVFNDNQILQIDADYRNARYAFGGTATSTAVGSTSYYVNINLDANTSTAVECPMVLIRPTLDNQYVGGCFVNSPHGAVGSFPARPNGAIQLWGQCPFEYAILSTRIGMGSGGSTFGFDVFDASGNLVFASGYSQLRITETFDDLDSSWPKTFPLTKGQSNPWIWANPLLGISGGTFNEQFPGIVMRFNSGRTALTVNVVDLITMGALSGGNPFAGTRRLFGTAAY